MTYERSVRWLVMLLVLALIVSALQEQMWLAVSAIVVMVLLAMIEFYVDVGCPDDPDLAEIYRELRIRGRRIVSVSDSAKEITYVGGGGRRRRTRDPRRWPPEVVEQGREFWHGTLKGKTKGSTPLVSTEGDPR